MNIEKYIEHIDRMIRAMDGSAVLNGSAEHAAVINERMFNYAERSMDIMTRNLDPRVYGTDDLVASAKLFLGLPDRNLRIAVENVDSLTLTEHPLTSALAGHKNFEVRGVPADLHELVDVNFTVMDGSSYRFERDKTEAVAVASFGDKTEFSKKLGGFFEKVWVQTELIEGAVEQTDIS